MNFLKNTWNEIPPIAKTIIVVGGGYLAYRRGKIIYNRIKVRQDAKEYGQANVPIIVTSNGQQVQSNINLKNIASKIYEAFYNADWFGVTEDEETAIKAIKQVPKALINKLMQEYAKLYNKNLQNDFVKFLSPTDYDRVEYLFN